MIDTITLASIKQRLSLRLPLQESLDILADVADRLPLTKDNDPVQALADVQAVYPTCTNFERTFPSICFSIATGVGKTRLMGASIAYLHLAKGIRNFFILSPNLTIYEKLIEDFGNPNHPKYVFNGLSEFVHNRPIVITGENYNQVSDLFSEDEIRINIFNVAKFNSDNKTTKSGGQVQRPRIKRLSEYLGQSYWEYLSQVPDLVMMMDEAHRYHADASKTAINELRPVLGLELTATPIDEKGNLFKNVVYEYSLAKALADGLYVKAPAIATRKDFNPAGRSEAEIETIKLEDALSIHEKTKEELAVYAKNANVPYVKPFVLVVCRDTTHAKATFEAINQHTFFEGMYQGKVLQIDSTTRTTEQVEQQFVNLEHPDNEIEIVIHVNMLKEGWDVSNLYTIVPLRAANAPTLIEQTIGRGLRLPYNGQRTGVEAIDKLTIVSHDNFDKVILAAQNPNSILNKVNFIEIDAQELAEPAKAVTAKSTVSVQLDEEAKRIAQIQDEPTRQKQKHILDAKQAIITQLPLMNTNPLVKTAGDLSKPDVKAAVLANVERELSKGQLNVFAGNILREAEIIYDQVVNNFKQNIIEIPRMDLVQGDVEAYFTDFDLDVSGFRYQALEKEIMVYDLKDHTTTTLKARTTAKGTPLRSLVSELINYPEIDYDQNADLLFKLSQQALNALSETVDDAKQVSELVFDYKKLIARRVYDQMMAHHEVIEPDYVAPNVRPFTKIEDWNFTTLAQHGVKDYSEPITPASSIPKYIFRGFKKAGHLEYKFDSKAEKDLAFVLENDGSVVKWLRPAPEQFRIYWNRNSQRYRPDFVVETAHAIYIAETKDASRIQNKDPEVLEKARAAIKYCQYATEFTAQHGGKPWLYLLIPHTEVTLSSSFSQLVNLHTKMLVD